MMTDRKLLAETLADIANELSSVMHRFETAVVLIADIIQAMDDGQCDEC